MNGIDCLSSRWQLMEFGSIARKPAEVELDF